MQLRVCWLALALGMVGTGCAASAVSTDESQQAAEVLSLTDRVAAIVDDQLNQPGSPMRIAQDLAVRTLADYMDVMRPNLAVVPLGSDVDVTWYRIGRATLPWAWRSVLQLEARPGGHGQLAYAAIGLEAARMAEWAREVIAHEPALANSDDARHSAELLRFAGQALVPVFQDPHVRRARMVAIESLQSQLAGALGSAEEFLAYLRFARTPLTAADFALYDSPATIDPHAAKLQRFRVYAKLHGADWLMGWVMAVLPPQQLFQ